MIGVEVGGWLIIVDLEDCPHLGDWSLALVPRLDASPCHPPCPCPTLPPACLPLPPPTPFPHLLHPHLPPPRVLRVRTRALHVAFMARSMVRDRACWFALPHSLANGLMRWVAWFAVLLPRTRSCACVLFYINHSTARMRAARRAWRHLILPSPPRATYTRGPACRAGDDILVARATTISLFGFAP